jgi:hypothetical protein
MKLLIKLCINLCGLYYQHFWILISRYPDVFLSIATYLAVTVLFTFLTSNCTGCANRITRPALEMVPVLKSWPELQRKNRGFQPG